jgi:protein SCO1/2
MRRFLGTDPRTCLARHGLRLGLARAIGIAAAGVLAAALVSQGSAGAHEAAVVAAKAAGQSGTPTLADYDTHQLKVGGDFTLTNQDGRTRRLSEFRPQAVLLFFGYTHCPDLCPLTTAKMAHLRKSLAAQGLPVQPILVSVDPERDTPERMKAYLAGFDGGVEGLTGTKAAILRAAKLFKVRAEKQEGPASIDPYLMSHTLYLFLLDGRGRLRYLFPADADDALLAAGVRKIAAR